MSDEHDDRRRAERIVVNDEFARLPEATYISDLNEYGVFVHTRQPPAVGALVDLRFTVLMEDPIVLEARGRVVRHSRDPRGMGVEFTALSPEGMLRINDILTQQQVKAVPVEESFDSAQTQAKGQIPIRPEELELLTKRAKQVDVDERTTSRYPALDPSASASGNVLGTGEYEIVDEDADEDPDGQDPP